MFHVIDIRVKVSMPYVVTHLHWTPTFEGLGVDLSFKNIQQTKNIYFSRVCISGGAEN